MKKLLLALFLCLPLAVSADGYVDTLSYLASGGGGGGGGAFTFIDSASGANDGPGTTVVTSTTLNVGPGDLLIAAVQWEDDGGATVTSITDGGSNALTFDTGDDVHSGSNEINLFPHYKLSASTNASATFTATINPTGSDVSYMKLVVLQFRPGGCPGSCETVTKDISGTRENAGTGSSTATTGSFSTTGSDVVACGLAGFYTSGTWVTPTIDSVGADADESPSGLSGWCRTVSSALSAVTGSNDYTFSNTWAATAIAFKSE